MQNSKDNKDSEISLKSIFFYVLKGWKILVICTVIGGLLGTGVSLWKMKKNRAGQSDATSVSEEDINVERVKLYRDYAEMYERERAYRDESLLIRMNSNAVYRGELEYLLTCTEDKMNEVGIVLTDIMQSEERSSRLLAESGLTCTAKAFAELVTIDFEPETNGEEFITEAGIIRKHDVKLSILVRTPDETSCVRLMNAFRDEMEEIAEDIEVQYPENYVSDVVKDRIVFGRDDLLSEKQAAEVNVINNFLTNRNSLKDKLTPAELAYYEAQYGNKENSETPASPAEFSKKPPVLGAAAGLFLPILLLALYFILCGKIRDDEDVTEGFGVKLLGLLPGEEKKGILLDRPIARWAASCSAPLRDTDYTKSVLSAEGFEKAYLVARTEIEKKYAAELSEKDGRLQIVNGFYEDPELVRKLGNEDAVVLMATCWETRNLPVRRDLGVCADKGVRVLGAVLIR